ncbi:MAG: hypothetical protein JWP08_1773 [Bryobacterales bacterium]|jgi:hypothetical protein|nr:hypothetical protein [Bryobacterales bacterium]
MVARITEQQEGGQTYGSCSKEIVLPNESQAKYDSLFQNWLADYQPADETALWLVEQACNAQWLLIRNQERYNEAEDCVFGQQEHAMDWTEEHHERIVRFRRYLTTAERQFARALSMLEQRRGSRLREGLALERARERAERLRGHPNPEEKN